MSDLKASAVDFVPTFGARLRAVQATDVTIISPAVDSWQPQTARAAQPRATPPMASAPCSSRTTIDHPPPAPTTPSCSTPAPPRAGNTLPLDATGSSDGRLILVVYGRHRHGPAVVDSDSPRHIRRGLESPLNCHFFCSLVVTARHAQSRWGTLITCRWLFHAKRPSSPAG